LNKINAGHVWKPEVASLRRHRKGLPDMRRLPIVLLAAVFLVAACSSSIPRHPAVYSPPAPPTGASAEPAAETPADGSPEASSPAVDTSAWISLAPQGEVFSVKMPGAATSSTQTVKTPGGNAAIASWTYTDASKRAFDVSRARFAKGALSGAPAKTIFDQASAMVVASLSGATITSQSDVTLGKYPGRMVRFANATMSVVCVLYIAGDDVLGPSVSAPVGLADDGFSHAFMASFQLTA
jgi:hypothetical protein